MYKNIIIAILLLTLVGWGIYDTLSDRTNQTSESPVAMKEPPSQSKKTKASDFTLKTLDGRDVRLSQLEGKKVILNFWATWCPPCRAEMPDMQKFYKEYKDKNVEILAVNLTSSERGRDEVKKFLDEFGITFPVVLDEKNDVATMYKVEAIPSSFLIDSKGQVQHTITGPMSYNWMMDMVNDME